MVRGGSSADTQEDGVFGAKPRAENRTKVAVRASLRDRGPQRDVCILDVSTRGLLATTATPPKFGEFVEILVNDKSLVGHVKWSSSRRFGIVLQDRISVINFLNGTNGSIKLPTKRGRVVAKQATVSTYTSSRRTAQLLQFAFFIALTGIAAIIIGHAINLTLGSIKLAG